MYTFACEAIIKNNDRVFIDGLITTTKSAHVYDPENSFGKAAKNHMKFVPRVNDHGRHSAACILGCVHDAAFFQSPTAYNGSADGQPIQLEQPFSFFRSMCRLYVIRILWYLDDFLICGETQVECAWARDEAVTLFRELGLLQSSGRIRSMTA